MIAMGKNGKNARKQAFLKAFAKTGNITKSAKLAGINPKTAHEWKNTDPEFVEQMQDAYDEFTDSLESEIYERAVKGSIEKVYDRSGKKVVGIKRHRPSDLLLIVLLKKHIPEYRDRELKLNAEDVIEAVRRLALEKSRTVDQPAVAGHITADSNGASPPAPDSSTNGAAT